MSFWGSQKQGFYGLARSTHTCRLGLSYGMNSIHDVAGYQGECHAWQSCNMLYGLNKGLCKWLAAGILEGPWTGHQSEEGPMRKDTEDRILFTSNPESVMASKRAYYLQGAWKNLLWTWQVFWLCCTFHAVP